MTRLVSGEPAPAEPPDRAMRPQTLAEFVTKLSKLPLAHQPGRRGAFDTAGHRDGEPAGRGPERPGGRRGVEVSDLQTGNVEAGRQYFNGAGTCSTCHSPTGDLAGIADRRKGLDLLERMLYPSPRADSPSAAKAT